MVDAGPAVAAAAAASSPEVEPGLAGGELDRMLASLGDPAIESRRLAAGALIATGSDGVAVIARKLAQLRRESDEGAAAVLKGMHDRLTREATFDLLEALVIQRPDPAQRRALAMDCMLRSLARAATTPAIRELVAAGPDVAGAFRPEITRLVKQLGERAIPALVESRRDPLPEVRSWGATLLEAIGKRPPADAVRTKDDRLLADILRAYGKVGDMEALPVVLSLANCDRAVVRVAAREATLAYGQDAVWRLRESYAVLLGEQASDGTPAADLANRLFEAYDRYRLRDVYALVDRGLTLQREGKIDDAIAAFDEALAREPLVDRRTEMAAAYVQRANGRASSDPASALADLRKALRLDEAGAQSRHVLSEVRRLEGAALVAQGIDDTAPFEQALALDPANAAAADALQRMRPPADQSQRSRWRLVAAGAVLALAAAGVVVLGGRKR
jgi:tetratricopeptide (TPR) repeat protein